MTEGKGVDAVMIAVVCCSIVQEASYKTALEFPLAFRMLPK
jgi:hypothetical protein